MQRHLVSSRCLYRFDATRLTRRGQDTLVQTVQAIWMLLYAYLEKMSARRCEDILRLGRTTWSCCSATRCVRVVCSVVSLWHLPRMNAC
ncbi:hypothetical protein C8Q72DRAFT_945205 [Fomitopsis betulina]|nr:hypothetical protein C8Q72DRAFT_945205 [Fomitopsis betulina]